MSQNKGDPAWKYCDKVPNNKFGTICKFCGHIMQSGGITRFKFHLTGAEVYKNVRQCPNVPAEVKREILELSNKKVQMKQKKAALFEDIRQEIRGNLGQFQSQDEEDDNDIYQFPSDLHPDEREGYIAAMQASKASEFQREEERRMERENSCRWGTSGAGGSNQPQQFRRTQSVREPPPIAPSIFKSSRTKQKNLKDMFTGGSIREKMGRMISKFFIYENIPPHKASSPHFKNMISTIQEAGQGVIPPSPYEIRSKYLDNEYKDMKDYLDSFKSKWETYGCTIMCDGWTGPTRLSIINFMVYCKGSTVFLKSVDASNKVKDHHYIYGLLKDVVNEVGRKNVVQIVTDNGSAFVKAGKKMMKNYSLYWTPCAAHCMDLIFEDIGKKDIIATTINKARGVTNFIYNHGWLLSQMREVCQGELVRPGATRFATNYIALDSLQRKKANLKRLFTSDAWATNRLSKTENGKKIEQRVLDNEFWDSVGLVVKIYEPLYTVLRLVDTEVVPTMPMLYEAMRTLIERIGMQRGSRWVQNIVQTRWDGMLNQPLHAAAYYLNPNFQYKNNLGDDPNLIQVVHKVYMQLDPNAHGISNFGNELTYFKDARKSFGQKAAVASRSTMQPADWWVMYGNSAPSVRDIAIKVLSQTASSSACERNWSTFALIHTKQRNRLAYKNIEKLVFCSYNMKLKIRDMAVDRDREVQSQMDFTDIFESPMETTAGIENPIFPWVTSAHLDDNDGNPDPRVATYARECGIDVEQVLTEEVGVNSSSDDQESSNSSSGDESGGVGGGNGGGDGGERMYPSYLNPPLYPFTPANQYLYANEDTNRGNTSTGQESHDRQQMDDETLSMTFSSMSIGTEHNYSDDLRSQAELGSGSSSNVQHGVGSRLIPNVPYYGTYRGYNVFDYPSSQMPYDISMHTGQQYQPTWMNPNYPIYGSVGRNEATYMWHINNYLQNYASTFSWQSYCATQDCNTSYVFEAPRNSFWY